MSPNCQRRAFTFEGTDLSSTGVHTYCLSLRDANKCEYDCSLFWNNLLLERLGINVVKRTVGYMAFRRALSINLLPRAILAFVYMCPSFWYKVISIHQAIHLVRIQIYSVEVYNQYFATFVFLVHAQAVAIFLQFHRLRSYRNDYFPLQLIDHITFLLSFQMCHIN